MSFFVKRFFPYYSNREKFILSMAVVVFVVLSCTLYWLTLKSTQATLNEEFSHREQVVARAGSISISNFINLLGKNVTLLAEDLSGDVSLGEKEINVNRFMEHWRGTPVIAILLADKNGNVLAEANQFGSPDTGVSVTDKPYFNWAKTAKSGDYFTFPPIMGTIGYPKGKYIVTVASPVAVNGGFGGLVVVAISLNDLTKNFINSLKFSENTRVYLIDEKGVVLSSLTNNFIGLNYIGYLSNLSYESKDESVGKLGSILTSTEGEGKFQIELPDSLRSDVTTNYIVAYSRVEVGTSKWLLVVASPEEESSVFLWKIKDANFGIFVFSLILVFLFASAHMRADRLREKERLLR